MPRARRKRNSFRAQTPSKMATVKSLEDMLSSEVDEPAVNALVASLESQLASTNAQHPNQEINSIASVNHVNSASTADGAVVRLLDGPKLTVGTATTQAVTSGPKSVVSSQFADELPSATSAATNVMVTLPGALPASGYITQVTGAPQQSFFNPVGGATIAVSRPLTTTNQDIKIVYTTQSVVSPITVNNTLRSNLKSTTIANGTPTSVNMITVRPGQPLVTVNAVSALSGSTTSMSAMHDLANVASQQTPMVIPNTCASSVPTTPVSTIAVQQTLQNKSVSRPTTRMQLRDRGGKNMADVNKVVITSRAQETTSFNTVTTQSISVIPPKSQPVSSHHVNVVSQVVTNPSLLPAGVQIINVNPKLGPPGLGTKTLAPRVLVTNPVRIAAAPQIMTTRPGVAGQRMSSNVPVKIESPYRQVHVARSCLSPKFLPLQGNKNTITLQPGMVRGAILVKTENGPLQVVNLASGSGGTLPAGTTYRLQSLPSGAQGVRTMSPQQMTVTVPVSGTSIKGNQATVSGAQTIVGTILHQGTPLNAVGSRLQGPNIASQTHQTVAVKVGVNGSLSTPLTVQTTTANNQTPSAPSQMSPNTAKKKCKNFLSTLIRLADEQPPPVAKSVRNLIQGIIDGTIQAEEFTAKLQKELNSAPQPYLVPFLKKNLPFLRHSLITKELTIEGVRPPPPGALSLPHPSQIGNFQHVQASQKRPTQMGTPMRLVTTSSSQLIHTNQTLAQRFMGPRAQSSLIGQTKSLLVSQMNKGSLVGSVAAASPATVNALQAKSALARTLPLLSSKDKGKNTFSTLRDDDDINDVAAMGGVNLVEESQKILASNSEIIGTQIRSCKDESFLLTGSLFRKIHLIATKHGLEEVSPDVPALVAHAAQERLKTMIEKLAIIAEHRVDNPKNDSRYEVTQDVKSQIKFIGELDRLERQRHEKQEWEILTRVAKSRSKLEDPEQLKLKQKAKEMQRAEIEKARQQDANATALLAIGQRKKMKMDPSASGSNQLNNTYQKALPRPRVKRVNLRDLLFLMEQERETVRTPLLYKSYLK